MRLDKNLQYLRKKNKITQEELAEKLDVSRQSVSKWETGEAYPETEKLIALCDLFGVSLDDLVRGDVAGGEEEPQTQEEPPSLSIKDDRYVKHVNGFAIAMAVGVALILIGVAICVIISGFSETLKGNVSELTSILGGVAVILFTAVALFLFIYKGMAHDRFKINHPTVHNPDGKGPDGKVFPTAMACLVAGILIDVVFLVVMTALVNTGIIVTANADATTCYITGSFLFILGLIIGGLVYIGIKRDANDVDKYNRKNVIQHTAKENANSPREKLVHAICGAVMLSATAVFLLLGFIGNYWHPGWVVFPVAGIICGIISTIMRAKY